MAGVRISMKLPMYLYYHGIFCRVLAYVIQLPVVAMSSCLLLCVAPSGSHAVASKEWINRFPNHVTGSKWKILFAQDKFLTSSFGVQLCGRIKHQHVTILFNKVLEATFLFYWFVLKFIVFMILISFISSLFVLFLWVVEYCVLYPLDVHLQTGTLGKGMKHVILRMNS